MKKKTVIQLSALGTAVLLLVIFVIVFFFTQRISYDTTITAGVQYPVSITRDDRGIPVIKAQSRDDICYALGYLHAQDRFIAMEYLRAIANSTISRLIGERGVILEKTIKTAGIRSRARAMEENLPSPYREHLKAYASGINHIKHTWTHLFQDVMIQDDWTESDVIAILLLREWSHAFINNRELMFKIPETKRSIFLREIFPPDMTYTFDEDKHASVDMLDNIRDLLKEFMGPFNEGFAVAVSGAGGDSLTACSMKSVTNNYPGWYPVHIHFGEIVIRGVSQAGLPFLFSGDNQNIRFFGFNLAVDTQDFVLEEVKNINGIIHYRSRLGWKEFNTVREPLTSKKSEVDRHDIVWYTDNGPVLNDIFGSESYNETVVTIKALFPEADYIVSLFEIPFSENIDKARKNITGVSSLPRVYLFSDRTSSIKCYSGKMPLRPPSTAVLKPSFYETWYGTTDLSIYFKQDAKLIIAGSSFMIDAPPVLRGSAIAEDERQKYLQTLLEERTSLLDENRLKEILTDSYNPTAQKFTTLFLSMLQTNPVTSARLARIYFKDWDFRMTGNSVAPSIYYGLLNNYLSEMLKDEFGYMIDEILENSPLLLDSFYKAAQEKQSYYFDDIKTDSVESSEEIFDRAFLKTMREISRKRGPIMNDWTWGSIHRTHYRLPIKKSFTSKMYYDLKEQAYDGGTMTIYNNNTGSDLIPMSNTSLLAVFSREKTAIAMDFAYSINPLSDFYYGKHRKQRFINFKDIEDVHITTINPAGK